MYVDTNHLQYVYLYTTLNNRVAQPGLFDQSDRSRIGLAVRLFSELRHRSIRLTAPAIRMKLWLNRTRSSWTVPPEFQPPGGSGYLR